MNTILESLTAVVNSLWQAVAVAALVWVALRFWPRTNAATRYAIWWATLVVVLILPIAPRWIAMVRAHRQNATVKTTGRAPITARPAIHFEPVVIPAAPRRAARWPIAVVAIWAAILAWRLWQIGRSYLYLRGVKRRSIVSTIPLPAIRRRAALLISPDIVSPMAVGFLRPAVVLPESLIEELSETEREHVLLHEAAHLARQDDWANLAMRILGGVLALHPVAIWILRRIDREREIACDDWVVARTGAARPYALSLARLFELRQARREQVLASGIFGSASSIGDRVEALLRRHRGFSTRMSLPAVVIGAGFLCGSVLAGALVPCVVTFAQTPPRRAFEVASVKPADTADLRTSIEIHPGGRFEAVATLKALIGFAFDVQDHDIRSGPAWIDSRAYRIDATMGSRVQQPSEPVLREMLESLLARRFRLSVHRETREEAVYELLPAKGGARLKAAASSGPPHLSNGRGRIAGQAASTGMLARMLAGRVGRVVIDKTALQGTYDFELTWVPAPGERDDGAIAGALGDPDGPTLFTALQEQLGLRLQPARDAVEVLAIDRAEKPDAN